MRATEEDRRWMQVAVRLAEAAADLGEVPIGAVVVRGGTELAAGHNRTLTDCDPTAHAEVVALRAAAHRLRNHRLLDTTLYVTAEPCILCVGAAVQARLRRVVFGCRDPKAGALGSVYPLRAHERLNHRLEVTGGVEEEICAELLRRFFRSRRD